MVYSVWCMVYGVPVNARHTLAEVLEPLDHASPGYGIAYEHSARAQCMSTVYEYRV
jgi:hypothetical protein